MSCPPDRILFQLQFRINTAAPLQVLPRCAPPSAAAGGGTWATQANFLIFSLDQPRIRTDERTLNANDHAGAPNLDFETWDSPIFKSPPSTYTRNYAGQRILPPISMNPDPSTLARHPAPGYPNRVRARRSRPIARSPDVTTAIPSIVAGDPNPTGVQGRSRMLDHNRGWRSDTNHDLWACRIRRADGEADSAECNKNALFHLHTCSGRSYFSIK